MLHFPRKFTQETRKWPLRKSAIQRPKNSMTTCKDNAEINLRKEWKLLNVCGSEKSLSSSGVQFSTIKAKMHTESEMRVSPQGLWRSFLPKWRVSRMASRKIYCNWLWHKVPLLFVGRRLRQVKEFQPFWKRGKLHCLLKNSSRRWEQEKF